MLLLFTIMATKGRVGLCWATQKIEEGCDLFYIFPERKMGVGLDRFGNKEGLYQ
jgi:hypothetical protein